MLPAATKKGGDVFALLDMCKTPPDNVPKPYKNSKSLTSAVSTANNVLVENKATVTQASVVPLTTGDEAGLTLGAKSSTIKGKAEFTTYSSKVYAEGKKVVYHTAVTKQNQANIIGLHKSASQSKVIVAL